VFTRSLPSFYLIPSFGREREREGEREREKEGWREGEGGKMREKGSFLIDILQTHFIVV
jgi:hypothetical protein